MSGSTLSPDDPVTNEPSLNGSFSGNRVGNGIANGKIKAPPEIPHVTNNIIPLSNILKFYTQEAYKQLTTIIENLSNTRDSESDTNRKKKFLQLIISLRQNFVKIYTLVKWSSNSKDISKLIDVLNWLRTQEFYFEHLCYGLNELNRYSGAKLPNSDLVTSLEVLIKGRPQLPSYNLIKVPKISAEKTLEVLQDLNLILMTRMALTSNLPRRFINNYEIKDGRIYFTIPNEFQVSVTIANDLLIENEEDYYKSPFYFIDFKFLFGINPETSLITHDNNKVLTKLPKSSHETLEKVVNNVVLNQGLTGMYDLLHKYSISFKLYLIARQLKDLAMNSKWRNNIQFKYQNGKSLIIINYWSSHYLSKNWKSFIELGIDKHHNLNFRWFKNGKYNLNHGISGIFDKDGNIDEKDQNDTIDEPEDLSVDLILNIIVNKHSELLISMIYEKLNKILPTEEDACSYISPHQLLIKLSPQKSTVFAINPLTGFFYFIDPTPIQNQIIKKINSQPTTHSNFLSENDMVKNIVDNLVQLRLEAFTKEINNKLITISWITNEIIKLNDYEVIKLFIGDVFDSNYNKIQFYRRKSWPSSWFLINLISGITANTHWWVARTKSIKGEWKIQWVQKLKFEKKEIQLDYKFFNNLSTLCSNMIIDHMILEELQIRNIRYIKDINIDRVVKKFDIHIQEEQHDNLIKVGDTPLIYESIIIIYNNNDLLPIHNSSTSLFLKIKLINLNNLTQMKLKLFGNLRNLSIKNFKADNLKLNLKIDETNNLFEIDDSISLSSQINENSHTTDSKLLDKIFNNLNKLNELIKILDQLIKNNIKIISSTINEITMKIDENINNLIIKLPENSMESIKLFEAVEKDNEKSNEIKLILSFLDKYLSNHLYENTIIGIIKYLKEIIPIIKSIKLTKTRINNSTFKLNNGISKINFEIKIPNLNLIQFIYYLNYSNVNTAKKIFKDKIVINLSFKYNKFNKINKNFIKVSMKDNLNAKNLKYKKLFELIFKSINDFEIEQLKLVQERVKQAKISVPIIKLNYDFLIDPSLIEKLILKITECFLVYLQSEK